MLDQVNALKIANLCYQIDEVCRRELCQGHIANERDYVSTLNTFIRFPFGPFSKTRLAMARTLRQNVETKFGCDSIILFKKGNKVKVGLFEAKLPGKSSKSRSKWDEIPKGKRKSRFCSQLERQSNWAGSGAYIWEMFFNELCPGQSSAPYDDLGSSCLPHDEAFQYMNNNKLTSPKRWYNKDLDDVLKNAINFKKVICKILICDFGKEFPLEVDKITIRSKGEKDQVAVPVFTFSEEDEYGEFDKSLSSFMKETGLNHYLCFNLDEIDSITNENWLFA